MDSEMASRSSPYGARMTSFQTSRPWLDLFQTDFLQLSLSATSSKPPPHSDPDASAPPPDSTYHLLTLPSEILYSILALLEPEQLSTLAQVSTRLLSHAYDPRHWRRIAHATWPHETHVQLERRLHHYKTWRKLCVCRPHLRPNAVFVVRHQFAKTAFQTPTEEPQAPVFLITYHRFLRFYADGTVVSLTTPEPPHLAFRRIRRHFRPSHADRDKANPTIGHFHFDEASMQVVIALPMRHPRFPQMRSGTVYMHLSLASSKASAFDRLFLTQHYAIMDNDAGDPVTYHPPGAESKPFRLVPIWGFRTGVYREFPRDDDKDLAQWFEMKKAAREHRRRQQSATSTSH